MIVDAHRAAFFWVHDAGEPDKIADRIFVDAAGAGVGQVGEPSHFRRHAGEALDLRRGEEAVAGDDLGRKVDDHVMSLTLIRCAIKSKDGGIE